MEKLIIKDRNICVKFLGCLAFFFYIVSWSVSKYGDIAWYIGIGLPWLSLFFGLLINLLLHLLVRKEITGWGYSYAVSTILYVIVMVILTGELYPFLSHIGACTCFVASIYIDNLHLSISNNEREDIEQYAFLGEKLESIDRLILDIDKIDKNKVVDLILCQILECRIILDKLQEKGKKNAEMFAYLWHELYS